MRLLRDDMITGVSLWLFYLIPITSLLLISDVLDIAPAQDTNQCLLLLGRVYFLHDCTSEIWRSDSLIASVQALDAIS